MNYEFIRQILGNTEIADAATQEAKSITAKSYANVPVQWSASTRDSRDKRETQAEECIKITD